jgi:hypothetical protein
LFKSTKHFVLKFSDPLQIILWLSTYVFLDAETIKPILSDPVDLAMLCWLYSYLNHSKSLGNLCSGSNLFRPSQVNHEPVRPDFTPSPSTLLAWPSIYWPRPYYLVRHFCFGPLGQPPLAFLFLLFWLGRRSTCLQQAQDQDQVQIRGES